MTTGTDLSASSSTVLGILALLLLLAAVVGLLERTHRAAARRSLPPTADRAGTGDRDVARTAQDLRARPL